MFITLTISLIVSNGLTQCIFLPQYVLKTNCKPDDGLGQVETCSSLQ
jgi:hypothetical protein